MAVSNEHNATLNHGIVENGCAELVTRLAAR